MFDNDIPLEPIRDSEYYDSNITDQIPSPSIDQETSKKIFEEYNQNFAESSKKNDHTDVEKGEQFDLRSTLEQGVRRRIEYGRKLRHMGVTVRDLNVLGEQAGVGSISTNLAILKAIWPGYWYQKAKNKKNTPTFHILRDINFFCKDGEMLLVLGRPGSGCSSLLKVIANQRKEFYEVQGEIKYGGLSASEFEAFRGEAIYMPEEDRHYPSLTLFQTLDFILRTKTPGERFPEEGKKTWRTTVYELVTKMYGLVQQRDTKVGNEYVRGLSGGERKRLGISEAMICSGAIASWDGATRGLDSASALDYTKSLRIFSDTMKKTTIASFYQASQSIYDLFDRVLVLDHGKCIYFGKTSDAKQYFIDLGFDCEPRKSTPDFLTGVTNSQERIVREGFEDKAPKNSQEFEQIFKNSSQHAKVMRELDEYEAEIQREQPAVEFRDAVKQYKNKRRSSSVYTVSYLTQVKSLVVRQAELIAGNRFDLFSRYFSVLCQGFIYATTFLFLPLTPSGGFTRGGAIFIAILFNSFLQQAEVPGTFVGRGIIQRQKSYAMYHPSAFYISQVVMDIPILALQTIMFSLITYFLFGLDLVAGKFFIYLFTIFLTALCITQLFRIIGNLSPSLFLSQQILGPVLVVLLTYTGYSIPQTHMQGWLHWIYFVDPFAYAFKALFANEMSDLSFDCSSTGFVPSGPQYQQPQFRACLLPGAPPGSTIVTGEQYLSANFGFSTGEIAINMLIVFFFFLGYFFINIIAVEYIDWSSGRNSKKVFKKGYAPKESTAETELENARIVEEATKKMSEVDLHAGIFLWKDIKYTVKVKGGERLLLDNVDGWIKPGQMTALMGESGAGKTTLLDVLAKRKTQGKVEGTMLLNGLPLRIDFERIIGYVEQMDVHNQYLTVREVLRFCAKLRREPEVPDEEREAYVQQVIEMMEMKDLAEAQIGDGFWGLSAEERRRLSIGLELVAKPHILFLDEPTSGLDSQSAYNIIKFIRKLADAGMPLVCTIHQPSSILFEYFDRILLLGKGGKTVYFGDIGKNSRTISAYFERYGARSCSTEENPAEYILEVIGAGSSGKSEQDWPTLWKQSQENGQVKTEIENQTKSESEVESKKHHFSPKKSVKSQEEQNPPSERSKEKAPAQFDKQGNEINNDNNNPEQGPPRKFARSFFVQLKEVYYQLNIMFWRNPPYNAGRIFQALSVGLIIGFSCLGLGNSTSHLQIRVLAIFFILILGIQLISAALPQFLILRELFRRAYASRIYSWGPFSLGLIFVELPYLLVAASLAVVCCYWSAHLNAGNSLDTFFFWLAFVFFLYYCHSFGQVIGAASPNLSVALLLLPIFITILFLFAGAVVPPASFPHFWHWVYQVNPFHYFLESIITTVFHDLIVHCDQQDLIRFNPPPGQTCGQYTQAFFNSGNSGYIDNPNDTSLCGFCEFANGKQYYEQFGWSFSHRWRNFGFLNAYWIFNICIATFFIYLFRKQKR